MKIDLPKRKLALDFRSFESHCEDTQVLREAITEDDDDNDRPVQQQASV